MSRFMDENSVLHNGLKRLRNDAAHPDANLLSAFAERTLNARQRAAVLEHLSACAGCREVLAHAAAPGPQKFKMRWLAPVAALAAAAVISVVVSVPRAEVASPPMPTINVHAPDIPPLSAPEIPRHKKAATRSVIVRRAAPAVQVLTEAAPLPQTLNGQPEKPAPSLFRFAPNVATVATRARAIATTPDWVVLNGQLFHFTNDGGMKAIPVTVDGKPVRDPISSVDPQPTRVVVRTLGKQRFATPDLGEHWEKVDH